MRKAFAVVAVACGFLTTAAAQQPDPAVKQAAAKDDTPKAFVGVWVPVSCKYDGAEQMSDQTTRDSIRLSIENGQHKLYFLTDLAKMEGKRLSTATLSVDEKAGTFELTMTDGYKKGEKVHGVFAFDGDQMKLCYGPSDKPRPTKFDAPKDSGAFNEVWTRHKKK